MATHVASSMPQISESPEKKFFKANTLSKFYDNDHTYNKTYATNPRPSLHTDTSNQTRTPKHEQKVTLTKDDHSSKKPQDA